MGNLLDGKGLSDLETNEAFCTSSAIVSYACSSVQTKRSSIMLSLLLVFPALDKRVLTKGCFCFWWPHTPLDFSLLETYRKPANLLERRYSTEDSHNTGNFNPTRYSFRMVRGILSVQHWTFFFIIEGIVRRDLRFVVLERLTAACAGT